MSELISVIVPVYNCENYIKKCILSILENIYQNFELIIVDDGSTDKSLEICKSFQEKDKRIKVFSQKNSGVSIARNKGISMAMGKYIIFIDADDEISRYYLKDLFELIQKENAVLAQVGYTSSIDKISKDIDILLNEKEYTTDKAFKELWCNGDVNGYLWNKIFLKDIIINSKIMFCEEAIIWEDSLFIFQYLSSVKGNCYVSSNNDYYYRINSNSVTHKKETSKILDGKALVIQKISALNGKINGRDLENELNKVKINLVCARARNKDSISLERKRCYINLIRKTKSFSIKQRIKAEMMLMIINCKSVRYN